MQLYALDAHGNATFATHALKGIDYFCCECRKAVRLREGPHRRAHFYHHHPSSDCRQSGKSLIHLQVQYALQELFSEIDCRLEVLFPSSGRIADLVWEKEKLVFEVQCSPISSDEVMQRNRDYGQEGYQVVWILHDLRYNKRRATAAELWLQNHPHYYTDINEEGVGKFYDQWSPIEKGTRKNRSEIAYINLRKVNRRMSKGLRANWPLHFEGDLSDQGKIEEFEKLLPTPGNDERKIGFWGHLNRFYKIIFRHLLEKCCR